MTTTGKSLARPRWWSAEEFTLSVVSSSKRILTCICIVAVTSLCFEPGWLPDGFAVNGKEYRGRLPGLDAELILRAAFVPPPIHVSGWDMAAGAPKPTSRMVAPGAVYFFERADGRTFCEVDARSLWLAALGARIGEAFVRVVAGAWRR
jgi:CRISPR-associated protein Cmr3